MIHRAFFCLAVSTGLVACAVKTTSLGGPSGNQASASSTDDGGADSGMIVPSGDAGAVECHWYTWIPEPTTVDCEYLLPSGPSPNGPVFDAKGWDPHNIRVDVGPTKDIGQYAGTSDGCGTADGWYYVDPGNGQTPTLFMICPKTCATVATDGGYLRLSAIWCPSR